MGNVTLTELYLNQMAEEGPISLEAFLDRLLQGEFGSFTKEEILDFLEEMERQTMASIYTFSEARGLPEDLVAQTLEEERKRFSQLKERIEK